jgi:hypothetical protein
MTTDAVVEEKKVNPSVSYGRPDDVVNDARLTRDQKIAILREWHYDAVRLQDSAEENMTGGEPDRLQAVSNALLKLDISPSGEGKAVESGVPRPNSLDHETKQ